MQGIADFLTEWASGQLVTVFAGLPEWPPALLVGLDPSGTWVWVRGYMGWVDIFVDLALWASVLGFFIAFEAALWSVTVGMRILKWVHIIG